MLERLITEFGDIVEGLEARQEGDLRAALAARLTDDLERALGLAVREADKVLLAVAPDGQLEPRRERIDDGDADSVKPARNLVRVVVLAFTELAARVQLRHHDLGRGHTLPGMDADRDAAAIVDDRAGTVRIEHHLHLRRKAGQRLVDG